MKVLVEISIDDEWLKKRIAGRPRGMDEETGREAVLRALVAGAGYVIAKGGFDFDHEVRAFDSATSYIVRKLAS